MEVEPPKFVAYVGTRKVKLSRRSNFYDDFDHDLIATLRSDWELDVGNTFPSPEAASGKIQGCAVIALRKQYAGTLTHLDPGEMASSMGPMGCQI